MATAKRNFPPPPPPPLLFPYSLCLAVRGVWNLQHEICTCAWEAPSEVISRLPPELQKFQRSHCLCFPPYYREVPPLLHTTEKFLRCVVAFNKIEQFEDRGQSSFLASYSRLYRKCCLDSPRLRQGFTKVIVVRKFQLFGCSILTHGRNCHLFTAFI